MVPIQLSHERRQVFRHRGAGGVGEFGPQSGRKRLQELHRVEGDGGQTAHPNAPTDLPWPNRPVARLMSGIRQSRFCSEAAARFLRSRWFAGQTTAISKGAQTFLRPVPFAVPTRARALVTTLS